MSAGEIQRRFRNGLGSETGEENEAQIRVVSAGRIASYRLCGL